MCELWDAHCGDIHEKLTVLQQHHVVKRLDLVWCCQAALQWLGCSPVMEYVVIMDTPCLTPMCELWGAHCGDLHEKSTVLQQHHVVMLPDLVLCYRATLRWLGCSPVMEYVVIMDTPCLTLMCELWDAHSRDVHEKNDSVTTAPCCYASWSG